MELLLLAALGAGAWVVWKQSRGEDPTASMFGRAFAGCLGLGCLGMVVLFAVGVAILWFALQALTEIDFSLSGLGEQGDGDGAADPGGGRRRS